MTLPETPSQTIGPFFAVGLPWPDGPDVVADGTPSALWIGGQVTDGAGEPVPDALVETWQADPAGRFAGGSGASGFRGFGRCATDAEGRFRFVTVKPGAYPWKNHHNAWRPAHIHFSLFGRAFAQRLITQMYFPGDPLFPFDPILSSVPEAARERLVSSLDLDTTVPEWALGYRWDIVLRGRQATPLEDEDDGP